MYALFHSKDYSIKDLHEIKKHFIYTILPLFLFLNWNLMWSMLYVEWNMCGKLWFVCSSKIWTLVMLWFCSLSSHEWGLSYLFEVSWNCWRGCIVVFREISKCLIRVSFAISLRSYFDEGFFRARFKFSISFQFVSYFSNWNPKL